jgi:hypothetical protein
MLEHADSPQNRKVSGPGHAGWASLNADARVLISRVEEIVFQAKRDGKALRKKIMRVYNGF